MVHSYCDPSPDCTLGGGWCVRMASSQPPRPVAKHDTPGRGMDNASYSGWSRGRPHRSHIACIIAFLARCARCRCLHLAWMRAQSSRCCRRHHKYYFSVLHAETEEKNWSENKKDSKSIYTKLQMRVNNMEKITTMFLKQSINVNYSTTKEKWQRLSIYVYYHLLKPLVDCRMTLIDARHGRWIMEKGSTSADGSRKYFVYLEEWR
jgi:hypothetical protein